MLHKSFHLIKNCMAYVYIAKLKAIIFQKRLLSYHIVYDSLLQNTKLQIWFQAVAAQFWRGQKSRMPVLLKKGSVEMHKVEKASHMFVVHFEKNT